MQTFLALVLLPIFYCQKAFKIGNRYKGFLQLSNDKSGEHNEGMEDQTKILTVFLLNIIGCVFCCGGVQIVILVSKKMNAELINLKKNYTNFLEFKKLNELRKNYNEQKESLSKRPDENEWLLNEYRVRMNDESENISDQNSL